MALLNNPKEKFMKTELLQRITTLQEGTQGWTLTSQKVGDVFTIRVALPASYEGSEKAYPVLYTLDGDRSFGLVASTMAYINLGSNFGMGKQIPEMIVVGIGYERGVIPWLFTRVRDFTPTEDPTFNYNNPNFHIPVSGKAESFLHCLRKELMPALMAQYRIDPALKVVASHSMSGLFALYAMLQPESLFQKYLITCPFVGWDNKVIFRLEETYAQQHQELQAEVFMALTGHEPTPPYREEVQEFFERLQTRQYRNFRGHLASYLEDNHFSVWPKSLIDGLVYLFNEKL